MKSGIREEVTRLTRWSCRSVPFGALLLLLPSAVAFTGLAAERRITAQRIGDRERLDAELGLSTLGYWTGPIDGVFDSKSRHALVAFQKVEGRKRTGKLTSEELEALRIAVRPLPRYTGYAHVEIDLQRQVLFVVDEGDTVTHILPVCTGNEEFYVDHGQVHRAPRAAGTVQSTKKDSRVSR